MDHMTYAEFMYNLSVLNKAYTQSILALWGFKITY